MNQVIDQHLLDTSKQELSSQRRFKRSLIKAASNDSNTVSVSTAITDEERRAEVEDIKINADENSRKGLKRTQTQEQSEELLD